jgi:hypothetical protein
MFLITGCGRSGTKYMATVLRKAGLNVRHERPGKDGTVSAIWIVEDERYPVYHHQGPRPEFDLVLHQVRDPLKTIASLTTTRPGSWRWLARHVPIDLSDGILKIAAEFWYFWNLKCEARASYRYRIEDLPEEWETLRQLIGIPGELDKTVSTTVNARSHKKVKWPEIYQATSLCGSIREMGGRYGYKV